MKNRSRRSKYFYLLLIVFLCFTQSGLYAQYTVINGTVKDAETGEPLPFVNISLVGKNIGTTTDMKGYYELETQWASNEIKASFMGYKPVIKKLEKGVKQTINFELESNVEELEEVTITASNDRYKNKDNPAVSLIKHVLDHRDENRLKSEKLKFLEYDKYVKDQFDLNNFTEEWTKRTSLKSFRVAFEYIDTSEVNGKPYVPVLIKEKASRVYYRSEPKTSREIVKGLRISGFEDGVMGEGISQFLDKLGSEVDIYDSRIDLLDKSFTSPISRLGPNVYRYYVTDSIEVDGKTYKKLSFMPRNPRMVAFTGHMMVADSSQNYAVKEIELNVDKRINVNFLEDLRIIQEFDFQDSLGWMVIKDKMVVDVQPASRGMGLYNTKTVKYDNFIINQPRDEEYYSGLNESVIQDSANYRDEDFWENHRLDSLTEQEKGIYEMVDTIQSLPEFNTIVNIGELIVSGYIKAGRKLDLGPFTTFLSYNDVEGIRLKFGGRTNKNFHENWRFSAHTAYGLRDERFKVNAGAEYYFSTKPITKWEFQYINDIYQPGFDVPWRNQDNIFLSLRRTPANDMFYKEEYLTKFTKEWFVGLQNFIQIKNKRISTTYRNEFRPVIYDPEIRLTEDQTASPIRVTEFTLGTRLALNEKFVQGHFSRAPIKTTAPVFQLQYTYSPELLGDFEYHKIYFSTEKRFKLGIFGTTDVLLEANRIFGTVPFPLLEIFRGNETFAYDDRSFNMMNFVEFAGDQSVSLMLEHHFNGLLTTQVPFMDRLKWRAVVSAKAIWADITQQNRDFNNPDLFYHQVLAEERRLRDEPYMEVSAGIENILKLLRVDVVKRLNYLDNPNISSIRGVRGIGIRAKAQLSF